MRRSAAEAGHILSLEGVSFETGGKRILKDISLSVGRGEFVGLIGPNGAGKTTLLNCIVGINPPEGKIAVAGRETRRMSEKEIAGKITHMHQSTVITSPFLSLDIVLMGRYPHLGWLRGEGPGDYRIARENMEYTDTLRFEKAPVNTLSGGERQRVLFAKALTQQTDIILLDEPTANLDITHQEQLFRYCRELCGRGTAVVAAVHDLKIAARYCSRLVLMKEGEIISDGTPEGVLTSANLTRAYGVNALAYRNRITGEMDIHVFPGDRTMNGRRVHVIGGGGSATGTIRQLFERGCKVTAGVFSHGDSDMHAAEVFGLDYTACRPFSEITEDCHDKNVEMIRRSDITILCSMPFGRQNLKNLEAAGHASRLVIVEDDDPAGRDYTGGTALKLYEGLKAKAAVTTSARIHEVI